MDGRLDSNLPGRNHGGRIMKTKTLYTCIFIVSTFLVIVGCTPTNNISIHPSQTVASGLKPTTSPTITQKPTRTLPPQPTPHPTLPPDKVEQLFAALQDESCKLPCYLGIIPGQTTLQAAKEILVELGGSYVGENENEMIDGLRYTYTLDLGDQPSGEKIITQSVSLVTNNDIVQVLIVSSGTLVIKPPDFALETYRTFWQRYSASQIFFQLGKPENLTVGRIYRPDQFGARLVISYDKQNIEIVIYGTGQENNLCPNNEAEFLYHHMLLSYPDTTLDIYKAVGRGPLTDQKFDPPIENVFGVNSEEFYNSVLSDPAVCFEQIQKDSNP
jgi:hypothetical protein